MSYSVSTRSVLSDASGVATIPPNEHRHALIISAPSGRAAFLVIGAGDGSNKGPVLPKEGQPLTISHSDIGDAVKEAVTLIDSAGVQQTFSWVEVLYRDVQPRTCKGLPGYKDH